MAKCLNCNLEVQDNKLSTCPSCLDGNVLWPLENDLLSARYKPMKKLGKGAMGSVYQMDDIKFSSNIDGVIKAQLCLLQEDKDQFTREAEVLHELKHPGLPRVTDYFFYNAVGFLVMDFIDGGSLEEKMSKTKKPLPEDTVIDYAIQVLNILNYMHTQKTPIIHRDIKPANIIIEDTGKVYVVDLGSVRIHSSKDKDIPLGTPGFAAPEQFGKGAEPRSDIYALGVTMHYLLTNQDPDPNPQSFLPRISSINSSVSPELEAIVERAIQKNPKDRFKDANEMKQALENYLSIKNLSTKKATSQMPKYLGYGHVTSRQAIIQQIHQGKTSPKRLTLGGFLRKLTATSMLLGVAYVGFINFDSISYFAIDKYRRAESVIVSRNNYDAIDGKVSEEDYAGALALFQTHSGTLTPGDREGFKGRLLEIHPDKLFERAKNENDFNTKIALFQKVKGQYEALKIHNPDWRKEYLAAYLDNIKINMDHDHPDVCIKVINMMLSDSILFDTSGNFIFLTKDNKLSDDYVQKFTRSCSKLLDASSSRTSEASSFVNHKETALELIFQANSIFALHDNVFAVASTNGLYYKTSLLNEYAASVKNTLESLNNKCEHATRYMASLKLIAHMKKLESTAFTCTAFDVQKTLIKYAMDEDSKQLVYYPASSNSDGSASPTFPTASPAVSP